MSTFEDRGERKWYQGEYVRSMISPIIAFYYSTPAQPEWWSYVVLPREEGSA